MAPLLDRTHLRLLRQSRKPSPPHALVAASTHRKGLHRPSAATTTHHVQLSPSFLNSDSRCRHSAYVKLSSFPSLAYPSAMAGRDRFLRLEPTVLRHSTPRPFRALAPHPYAHTRKPHRQIRQRPPRNTFAGRSSIPITSRKIRRACSSSYRRSTPPHLRLQAPPHSRAARSQLCCIA